MTNVYQSHGDVDAVFECLSHTRRRYAIRCLREYEEPMALADLADEIAVRENGSPITEIPADDVKRIYLSLYHNHLPKLDSAGIARYDQEGDMVRLADDERLERFTDLVEGR
ncbi:hypothetical protein [Halostella sp. PRR32]|uniref:DUF7344 domain-containing protein n=1 Tax=Halostella sp. PRR32 TaxID=3098147 RepID=UPI002B1D687F|nr:hypothetical protein [Halostella sp. PRR32]